MSDRRMAAPPDVIYLQWYGDGDPSEDDGSGIDPSDVSWCVDKIFTHDVAYVRVDAIPGMPGRRGKEFEAWLASLPQVPTIPLPSREDTY